MEEKEYTVALRSRKNGVTNFDEFKVKASDVFVMNGKEFKFEDIAQINIYEPNSWTNADLSNFFPKKAKS